MFSFKLWVYFKISSLIFLLYTFEFFTSLFLWKSEAFRRMEESMKLCGAKEGAMSVDHLYQ